MREREREREWECLREVRSSLLERGGLSLSRARLRLRLRDRPRLGALSVCGERYGLSPILDAVAVEVVIVGVA